MTMPSQPSRGELATIIHNQQESLRFQNDLIDRAAELLTHDLLDVHDNTWWARRNQWLSDAGVDSR